MVLINQPPNDAQLAAQDAAQDAMDLAFLYQGSVAVDKNNKEGFRPVDPVQLNEGQQYWHAVLRKPNDQPDQVRMIRTTAERIDKKPDGTPEYIYTETKHRNGTVHRIIPVDKFYEQEEQGQDEQMAGRRRRKTRRGSKATRKTRGKRIRRRSLKRK
jgi:hypothetical protein